MRLELENEKEIMEYISNLKNLNDKYIRLEGLIKSIINHLPKKTQNKIKGILEEEYKK